MSVTSADELSSLTVVRQTHCDPFLRFLVMTTESEAIDIAAFYSLFDSLMGKCLAFAFCAGDGDGQPNRAYIASHGGKLLLVLQQLSLMCDWPIPTQTALASDIRHLTSTDAEPEHVLLDQDDSLFPTFLVSALFPDQAIESEDVQERFIVSGQDVARYLHTAALARPQREQLQLSDRQFQLSLGIGLVLLDKVYDRAQKYWDERHAVVPPPVSPFPLQETSIIRSNQRGGLIGTHGRPVGMNHPVLDSARTRLLANWSTLYTTAQALPVQRLQPGEYVIDEHERRWAETSLP